MLDESTIKGKLIWAVIIAVISALIYSIITVAIPKTIEKYSSPKPDTTIYTQTVNNGIVIFSSNQGKAIDAIKIEVSTIPYPIIDYQVRTGTQARLIEGGPNGNYAIFMIDELVPDTFQAITLITQATEFNRITAWSQYTGDIKSIYQNPVTIEWGPEESYEEWKSKQ